MRIAKCSVIAITLLCFLLLPILTAGRLCCDPQCRKAISYARTTTRNVKREPGHVMYSAGAVTTVLAKAAGMENEVELWEVEILGKKGLILSNALNEMSVMCETQHLVEVPDVDPQVHETGETFQQPMAQDDGEQIKHTESETFNPGQFQAATDTVHPSPEVPTATDAPDLGTQQEGGEGDLNGKTVNDDDIRYNGGETQNGGPPSETDISDEKPSPTPNGRLASNGKNIPNGAAPFPSASLLDQLQSTGSPVTGPPPPKVPKHVQRWREQQQQLHQQQQQQKQEELQQQEQQKQEELQQQEQQKQEELQQQEQQQVTSTPGKESQEGETRPAQQLELSVDDKPRTDSAANDDEYGHDREGGEGEGEGEVEETGGVLETSGEERVDQQTSEQSEKEAIPEDDGDSQFHGDRVGEKPGFQEEMELEVPEEDLPRQSQGEAYTADPDQASKTIAEEQPPIPTPPPPPFVPVPSQTTPIAWGSTTEDLLTESWNVKPSPLELHLEESEDEAYQITLKSGHKAKVSVREDRRIDVLLDDGKTFDVDLEYFNDLDEDILDFIDEKLLYDYDIDPEMLKLDEALQNWDEEAENWNEEFDRWNEESDHWNEETEYRNEEAEYKNDEVSDPVSADPKAQDTVGVTTTAAPNSDVAPDEEGLPGSAAGGGGEAATAPDTPPAAASEPAGDFEENIPGAFQERDQHDTLTLRGVPPEPDATAPIVESWVDQTTPFGRQPYTPETEERENSEKTGFIGTLALFLPTPLADWLLAQGPETGIVAVIATSLAVLIPMCCSCCSARKDSRKKNKMLREQKTSRHQLEEQLKKLKEEHALLADRVREVEGKCRGLEMELTGERETKADLETHYQRLAASLATSQEEVAQYRSHVEQLNTQLAQEQSQLAAQVQEREVTLQQLAHLATQLEEAGQHASEGDAARDQLEKEVFSVRDRLQELEGHHLQVTKEHEESKERHSQLESQLAKTQDELALLRETLAEKEQELKVMSECLQEVINPAGVAGTTEDTEGTDTGSGGERATETQLAKIKAMLDTTKVQHELNEVTGERDRLATEVKDCTLQVEKLQTDMTTLQAQVLSLTKEKQEVAKLLETTDSKLKTLTEFFEEQSKNLHRQRFEEEASRQAVETREAKALEQATAFEEERLREKEELKELRKQMADIEKSLMQQVVTNEKRAEEAQAQLRRTEQELRQANREVTILKRSLAEAMDDRARALVRPEQRPGPRGPRLRPRSPPPLGRSASSYGPPYLRPRPPSTGPPGTRQPPRPPSATHLPRTSSPGPDGGKRNVAGSSSEPAMSISLPVATQPPPHPPSTNPGSSELQGGPSLVPRLSTRAWSPRPFIPRAPYGAPPPGPPIPPHPPMGPRGWVGPPRGFPNMDRRHPPPPGPLPWRRPPPNEQCPPQRAPLLPTPRRPLLPTPRPFTPHPPPPHMSCMPHPPPLHPFTPPHTAHITEPCAPLPFMAAPETMTVFPVHMPAVYYAPPVLTPVPNA